MNYEIHHASSVKLDDRWFSGAIVVAGAECLPRIGDTIELNEIDYQVTMVWHPVIVDGVAPNLGMQGRASSFPLVRVK